MLTEGSEYNLGLNQCWPTCGTVIRLTHSGAKIAVSIQSNFRQVCGAIRQVCAFTSSVSCAGMFRWTAVQTHRIIVKREDESMENVPRTRGSGFQMWYCVPLDIVVFAISSAALSKAEYKLRARDTMYEIFSVCLMSDSERLLSCVGRRPW